MAILRLEWGMMGLAVIVELPCIILLIWVAPYVLRVALVAFKLAGSSIRVGSEEVSAIKNGRVIVAWPLQGLNKIAVVDRGIRIIRLPERDFRCLTWENIKGYNRITLSRWLFKPGQFKQLVADQKESSS
jgi:hypothetical protein